MVSVLMLTYNHENYIREAIEGVLMQKTDFPIELIIGEDCSTDNTRKIVIEYANKFPNIIKAQLHEKNRGMQNNFITIFEEACGKYIALCEGDDYWTDDCKLQKQFDFLEANNDYAICFHKVKVLEKNELLNCLITEDRYDSINEEPITTKHLLEAGNFIHTPSVVFRNVLREFPFEFLHSPVGDYFLYIMLSQHGYIKRLDDVMAVYRRGVGIYSSLNSTTMQKQVLIYQACILSYLDKEEFKKIMLAKQIALIKVIEEQNQSAIKADSENTSMQLMKRKVKAFIKKSISGDIKTSN